MKQKKRCRLIFFFFYYLLSGIFSVSLSQTGSYEQTAAQIMKSKQFLHEYNKTLTAINRFRLAVLMIELDDSIEEAVTSSGHVTTTSIRPKVNLFKQELFNILKEKICMPATRIKYSDSTKSRKVSISLDSLKALIVMSLLETSKKQRIKIDHSTVGMISAVLVALLQKVGSEQICLHKSFKKMIDQNE